MCNARDPTVAVRVPCFVAKKYVKVVRKKVLRKKKKRLKETEETR